jgi:antitoxin ParD1/3/4
MLKNTKNLTMIPRFGIFEQTLNSMAKNTSILLGDYFDKFISQQVQSGKFSSASEVVRAALRMFEHEEIKKTELINELKKGEESGFSKGFNRETFLNKLHKKHLVNNEV